MEKGKKVRLLKNFFGDIRILHALMVLTLGILGTWAVFCVTIAGVTRSKNPEIALKFVGGDAVALANLADQTFIRMFDDPPKEVRELAIAALKRQPINPKALRNLGYLADLEGDPAKAEQLIRMAAKLSRRETGAQMWLIETEARKGNIKKTLSHYDIAMRTKPDTHSILFPRLVTAIDDPEIREALRPYFNAKAPWTVNFVYFAVANSIVPSTVVDLIIETGGLRDQGTLHEQQIVLLNRLMRVGDYDNVRRLFLTMPDASGGVLVRASFDVSDHNARFGPLSWQITSNADSGGGFSSAAAKQQPSLSVFSNSGVTQRVAGKTTYLSPGKYRFFVNLVDVDENGGGYIRWQLSCRTKTGDKLVWSKDSVRTMNDDTISLPASCPVQLIEIVVSGGTLQGSFEATITDVKITPL